MANLVVADAAYNALHPTVPVGAWAIEQGVAGSNLTLRNDAAGGNSLPDPVPGQQVFFMPGNFGQIRFHWNGKGGTPAQPIVMTNTEGQAVLEYVELLGGHDIKFTGEFNPLLGTGDVNFMGHDAGIWGRTNGGYGISITQNFVASGISGLVISEDFHADGGDAPSGDVEVSYINVEGIGFACLQGKNDNFVQPTGRMKLWIHNNYLHDSLGGEAAYISSTSATNTQSETELIFENNLSVRAGAEGGQFGKLAAGSKIRNNTIVMPAQDWLSPFANFQDKAFQMSVMNGDIEVTRNVILGGADGMFMSDEYDWVDAGGTTHNSGLIDIYGNYFGDFRNILLFFGGSGDPLARTTWNFRDNFVGPAEFLENRKDTGNRVALIQGSNQNNNLSITNNTYDSSIADLFVWTGFANQSNITEAGTTQAAVTRPEFENDGYPANFQWGRSEQWKSVITASGAENGNVPQYPLGWYPVHDGVVYETLQATSGAVEPGVTVGWETDYQVYGPPADDFRLKQGSFYYNLGYGIRQRIVKKTGPFTASENLTYSVTVDGGAPPAWFVMTVEGNTDNNAATDIITFDFKAATQAENGTYAIVLTGTGPGGSGQQAFSVTVDTLL